MLNSPPSTTEAAAESDVGNSYDLFLIDGIGPFFRGMKKKRINWSKVPFRRLEKKKGQRGGLRNKLFEGIERDFETFCRRTARLGFNAVTLDDVAHLTDHPAYPAELRQKIAAYRQRFARLFEIAAEQGMAVYLTTDLMFFNATLERELGHDHERILEFLRQTFTELLDTFPALGGIVLRFGESDGVDVKGDFKSQLVVRSPRIARRYLKSLLPIFEQRGKRLIFRTWSVGAYRIGDLIWNEQTFERTFRGIDSPALVISMKPGASDFFRYLPLSSLFWHSHHAKILELQARREYEGCGQYPSFIGWDVETKRVQLASAKNLIGVSLWCQTGGWTRFRRLAFLDDGAVWNEINTEVALRIFRHGLSADQALAEYGRRELANHQPEDLRQFFALSDQVVKELLYVDDFASQEIFFRRSRVPPLLSVYWDRILINHSMRKLLRCYITDGDDKIEQGRLALDKIRQMQNLAERLGLPPEDLDFQYDTFEILQAGREYFFAPFDERIVQRLRELKKRYRKTWPVRYSVHLDFTPMPVKRVYLRWIFAVFLRQRQRYRLVDHIFTVRLLAAVYPLMRRWDGRFLPKFARKQAMGIDSIFK